MEKIPLSKMYCAKSFATRYPPHNRVLHIIVEKCEWRNVHCHILKCAKSFATRCYHEENRQKLAAHKSRMEKFPLPKMHCAKSFATRTRPHKSYGNKSKQNIFGKTKKVTVKT